MSHLFDGLSPINFPNLFTTMWVGALIIVAGTSIVYVMAQRRYRRYPAILSLHEWVFWSLAVPWTLVPLLAVIHVTLILILALVVPGMAIAAWAAFWKYPPIIAEANDEIRRRRYVPPPRRPTGKPRRR
jgi:hypothetical protein